MEYARVQKEFWKGKRVLLTGHTGFKGSWLSVFLLDLGAQVRGYSLPPRTEQDNYSVCGLHRQMDSVYGNILDEAKLMECMRSFRPEIIFHLAAQPLVRRSYEQPRDTYETNVIGTLNVLEAARSAGTVRSAVMITTDKCYENRGITRGYRETDPMGGYDPYSASKGCAELLISSYRRSYCCHGGTGQSEMAVASARAGNVIGGGDWSEDRLIPDCIRAVEAGEPIRLRNPTAVRPWQFVLEPLYGYLLLAEKLWDEPEAYIGGWNFGPDAKQIMTVEAMVHMLMSFWGEEQAEYHPDGSLHEDQILLLDSTKAWEHLGWKSRLSLEETLRWTFEWYRNRKSESPLEICRRQIHAFSEAKAARR